MMDPAELYFNLEGRASRIDWWIGMTPLVIMAIVLPDTLSYVLQLVFKGAVPGYKLYVLAHLVTAMLLLHSVLAIFIKRLHDLPRTGWWAFFILMPVFLAMAVNAAGLSLAALLQHPLVRLIAHAHFAVSFWFILEMALRRSQPGDSKYGPQPG